jgi:hypothetical protein
LPRGRNSADSKILLSGCDRSRKPRGGKFRARIGLLNELTASSLVSDRWVAVSVSSQRQARLPGKPF